MARGVVRVLCVLLAASSLVSCTRFGFKGRAACREPQVPVSPSDAPLKVAPGLDLPDTRNAVRVPDLKEPEKPRGRTDPCLSRPPAYGS